MKEEILEVGKELFIGGTKLLVGMGVTIVAGRYMNKEMDKADARLNPKRKGISKILHHDSKSTKKTK